MAGWLTEAWGRNARQAGIDALADRLSFRRFVGLGLAELIPDHSTLSRFRTALGAAGVRDRSKHRRHQHQTALPHWQQVRNRLIEARRSAVERVFGTLKRSDGYRWCTTAGCTATGSSCTAR